MSPRRAGLLGILAVAVGLGAVRDFLVLNLNYQIDHLAKNTAFSYAHSQFRAWVAHLDLQQLVVLKWLLAFGLAAAMLLLSVAFARLLFGDHRYRKVLVVGYAAVGALALLLHGLSGRVAGLGDVSIKLLHLLQYPVTLFFLWAASLLGRRSV